MRKGMIHITVRADYGGAPNYINTMINNMSNKFDIYIASPKDEPYYNIWKSNKRVKDMCFLPHRQFTIKDFFSLIKFVKKYDIQVLQANGKGAGSYRLIKLFYPKVKVLYAYRGFHIHNYSTVQRKLYFVYERFMTLFTDKVINVSKGEQNQCIDNNVLKKSLSSHIYNGIKPLEKKINSELEIKYKDKFVIATLSRFDVQKNMGLMYEIASKIKNHKNIQFIFIGDGDDKLILEQKAKKENLTNIDFVGFKNHDEISEYFTVTDVYLTTARWEGLPFALVEASSIGLPIIASDVVGNNEVCLHERNGILYPSENSSKAVEAIMTLYSDNVKLKEYGRNSLRVFEQYFTVNQMVNNHETLYEQIVDGL
jgi:glycosyltransferase involved in cell wall biosynthesis